MKNTPVKLTCKKCGRFIGLMRGHEDLPSPDPRSECCVKHVEKCRKEAKILSDFSDKGAADYGRWTGGGPGRSTWGSGSKDDDLGPWGENAVRDLEDCR